MPRQIKSAARRQAMAAKGNLSSTDGVKRAIVYARISVDKVGDGTSTERQIAACEALCMARGWDVVLVVEETLSATDWRLTDRPGWRKAVELIEGGDADLIVAWHLDRVTRDMGDLESLIELATERNIGLATATGDIDLTNDVGQMVARILAAVAKAEASRKAARQILKNDQKVQQGLPNWTRRPFGFEVFHDDKGHVVRIGHVADEAAAIKKAYEDVLNGKPIGAVAREWNEAGFRTSAPLTAGSRGLSEGVRKKKYSPNGKWTPVGVRVLLESPRNAGIINQYDEEMGKGAWEPIVEEQLYRAVVELLTVRKAPGSRTGSVENLLSGDLSTCYDDNCTLPMQASTRRGEPVYRCKAGHTSLNREYADNEIRSRLIIRAAELNRTSLYVDAETVDIGPLEAREKEIAELMAELVADRAAKLIDRAAMLAGTEALRAELVQVQKRIAEIGKAATTNKPKTQQATADWLSWSGDIMDKLSAEWNAEDLHGQRALVKNAFATIKITKAPLGKPSATNPRTHPGRLVTTWTNEWS